MCYVTKKRKTMLKTNKKTIVKTFEGVQSTYIDGDFDTPKGRFFLCKYKLMKYFDVPYDAEKIWITVSTTKPQNARGWQKATKAVDPEGLAHGFNSHIKINNDMIELYHYPLVQLKKLGIKNGDSFWFYAEYQP